MWLKVWKLLIPAGSVSFLLSVTVTLMSQIHYTDYSPFPPSRTLFNVMLSVSGCHGGLLKLTAAGFIINSDWMASRSSNCLTRTIQCSCSITTDSHSDKSLSAEVFVTSSAGFLYSNKRSTCINMPVTTQMNAVTSAISPKYCFMTNFNALLSLCANITIRN